MGMTALGGSENSMTSRLTAMQQHDPRELCEVHLAEVWIDGAHARFSLRYRASGFRRWLVICDRAVFASFVFKGSALRFVEHLRGIMER